MCYEEFFVGVEFPHSLLRTFKSSGFGLQGQGFQAWRWRLQFRVFGLRFLVEILGQYFPKRYFNKF